MEFVVFVIVIGIILWDREDRGVINRGEEWD
jgi:hypothetical protein